MRTRRRKITALFFLCLFLVQEFIPVVSYALTSGPAQPEMQKFQPAGAGDLVDLFTGDMKYNIPLMDVGGYPVNLAYGSGSGVEDEATWVGAGWTLNPGSLNRALRGLPDDFNGDKLVKEYSRKEFKKVGGQIVLKPSILAWEVGSASLKLNVYKDNYYGIGASVGASLGFQTAQNTDSYLTAGLNLDVNSDVRDGVSISPSFEISANQDEYKEISFNKLSGGFQYNTRAGLKEMSLGASFSSKFLADLSTINLAYTKYFGQTYTPVIATNTKNTSFTFSLDGGVSLFGGYLGFGGAGYVYKEQNAEATVSVPAYGYMHYMDGHKNLDGQLDFNREKDGVFIPSAPAIAMPVATQDFFTATGQTGSQQFRPYFAGNYIVFDRTHTSTSNNVKGGITLGGGNAYKLGARLDLQNGERITKKWTSGNNYLGVAAFDADPNNPLEEKVYLKQTGETTLADGEFLRRLGGDDTRQVVINDRQRRSGRATTYPLFKTRGQGGQAIATRQAEPQLRSTRDKRQLNFSYLTALQASKYALDKSIRSYQENNAVVEESRRLGNRKDHHMSEVTVTDTEGKRMVYGLPVYNTVQEEVTFSLNPATIGNLEKAKRTGLVTYNNTDASRGNKNGRDWLYSKDKMPPYATSFLLTAVLSPDYVDVTNNGITDDDLGTAVKLNYSKLPTSYQWRAPYDSYQANYNEGFLSDPKDDKASFVYGQKETWYLHSIESKTMIAFFKTSSREDGLGVNGRHGGKNTSVRLRKLDQIVLYAKPDLVKNPTTATPIKTVHFEYDYSICPGVINNTGAGVNKAGGSVDVNDPGNINASKGKLTLKKVYFTFARNSRGMSNPYTFDYDLRAINAGNMAGLPRPVPLNAGDAQDPLKLEGEDKFTERQQDRWGTYKQSWYNHLSGSASTVNNSEFPYALQKNAPPPNADPQAWRGMIDRMASHWMLTRITTPVSSEITIDYESDDYAYVQNRRAMQMCFVAGVGNTTGSSTGLINAAGLTIKLPEPVNGGSQSLFQRNYLEGVDGRPVNHLFFKLYTDLDNRGHYEYVHGYAEIDPEACAVSADGTTAFIALKKNNYNPAARIAWQMLRTDLPQYAYDYYDNSDVRDGEAAVRAIIQSVVNLGEIFKPFDKSAASKRFGDRINLSKSMVRLYTPNGAKTGGGCRVRQVTLADNWALMSQAPGVTTSTYGQVYDYTLQDTRYGKISSGVAAYEPALGNEENPFREPASYTEKVHWGLDRYHYIEKPFCESYFPGATVGYSHVTVTNFGSDYDGNGTPAKHTGYIENVFYTAKDFPTRVDNLPLDQTKYENNLTLYLFASKYINRVATAQGFSVKLNDMHGKSRGVKVYNQAGDLMSSSDQIYKTTNGHDDEDMDLDNQVDVMGDDGRINTVSHLGMDIDFITDVRESTNENTGTSIGAYNGGMALTFFYLPYIAVNYNGTVMKESYHSIASVKVIHQYGLLQKTIATENGSRIEAENLLWDGETGGVLLTRTQNEFDDHTYAFHYPAYRAYEGMSGAYKNLGALFTTFATNANGSVANPVHTAYLFPGDELVAVNGSARGWIIRSGDGSLRLIDGSGNFLNVSGAFQVIRSGRRNLVTASAGTVVTAVDPRVMVAMNPLVRQIQLDDRVLNAQANVFAEKWQVPVAVCGQTTNCWTMDANCGRMPTSPQVSLGALTKKACDWGEPRNNARLYTTFNTDGSGSVTELSTVGLWKASTGCVLNGPINRAAVWLDDGTPPPGPGTGDCPLRCGEITAGPYNEFIGHNFIYEATEPEILYVGIAADNYFKIKLNSTTLVDRTLLAGGNYSFTEWHIFPVCLGTPGRYFFEFYGMNVRSSGGEPTGGLLAVEVYKNTRQQLIDARSESDLDIIYTTKREVGHPFKLGQTLGLACPDSHYLDDSPGQQVMCRDCDLTLNPTPVGPPGSNTVINPYIAGLLGNWRPLTSYAYTVNRAQPAGLPTQNGGTNVRSSGYYESYTPFWRLQGAGLIDQSAQDNRWVWTERTVYYDRKGNEVESVDALNRYGAALFGYRESIATAVGANARRNEIAFDGFEDYDFELQGVPAGDYPLPRHLNWGLAKNEERWQSTAGYLTTDQAHTGLYSYRLTAAATISQGGGTAAPAIDALSYDAAGRYVLTANDLNKGFAPINGKRYLLSLWVNDNEPGVDKVQHLQIGINGQDMQIPGRVVPVVEGWKRLELTFTAAADFKLTLTRDGSNAPVYIDDVRLLPFDGQLNTFVYHPVNLRLVAQLDENNFATLYEYDDEGTPIRVKKETERGVMTLKENRMAYRKRN